MKTMLAISTLFALKISTAHADEMWFATNSSMRRH